MKYIQRWCYRSIPLRNDSMSALVVFQVILIFVVPFVTTPGSQSGRIVEDIFILVILLNGVITAADRPREFVIVALVSLVAVVLRMAHWLLPPTLAPAIREEATLLALVLLAMTIARKVFRSGTVTRDRIAGAVALYILVGVVWADAYDLVYLRVPDAFFSAPYDKISADRSNWIYFSLVTLTTLGYGDIVPVAHSARALANFEGLIGQLYPAIVLGRLVTLEIAARGSEKSEP